MERKEGRLCCGGRVDGRVATQKRLCVLRHNMTHFGLKEIIITSRLYCVMSNVAFARLSSLSIEGRSDRFLRNLLAGESAAFMAVETLSVGETILGNRRFTICHSLLIIHMHVNSSFIA